MSQGVRLFAIPRLRGGRIAHFSTFGFNLTSVFIFAWLWGLVQTEKGKRDGVYNSLINNTLFHREKRGAFVVRQYMIYSGCSVFPASPYLGRIPLIPALLTRIFADKMTQPYLCNASWVSFIPAKYPLSRHHFQRISAGIKGPTVLYIPCFRCMELRAGLKQI